jgi:hypothetical protein
MIDLSPASVDSTNPSTITLSLTFEEQVTWSDVTTVKVGPTLEAQAFGGMGAVVTAALYDTPLAPGTYDVAAVWADGSVSTAPVQLVST